MSSYLFTAVLMLMNLFSPISAIATNSNYTTHCSDDFSAAISFPNCMKLNTLGAQFGWRLGKDSWIDICIGAMIESEEGWLAWGVNPQDEPQMAGTRALIGIRKPDGSSSIKTYNVTSETKLGCRLLPSEIDIEVSREKFFWLNQAKLYTICATVRLPPATYSVSRLNIVWQVGFKSDGLGPLMHRKSLQHVDSTETIDLRSGTGESLAGKHRHRMRMAHGILNMIGWGTLMPIGVIIARYFRKFPVEYDHWIRLHIGCQITGYILGTIGWGIGLWLGRASKHFSFPIHRLMSHFIFAFTTLQMFALRLKPHSKDEYRKYWSMYHHFLGYALLALIGVNIFRGIGIFSPNHKWKWAYVGVLGALAFIILSLEIYTWFRFITIVRQKNKDDKTSNQKNDQKKNESTSSKKNESTSSI